MAYYATYMQDETGELQKVVINAGVGFVLPYYGETAPPGTLACDGSEISRATYDELFHVLGTKAGAGDGVTTFNLPDLRGVFVRGTGGNAAALGVEQGDAIRNATGLVRGILTTYDYDVDSGAAEGVFSATNPQEVHSGHMWNGPGTSGFLANISFGLDGVVPTAAENRPVNVALLWCIIYE